MYYQLQRVKKDRNNKIKVKEIRTNHGINAKSLKDLREELKELRSFHPQNNYRIVKMKVVDHAR